MAQEAERRQLLGPESGACAKLLLGLPWSHRLPLVSGGQPGNAEVFHSVGYAGNMHYVGVEPESWVLALLQLVAVLG